MIVFPIFEQVTRHFHFVMSLTNYMPSAYSLIRQWMGHPYLSWSSVFHRLDMPTGSDFLCLELFTIWNKTE